MLHVTLLDGYVDEPTCLGVPPYVSPYPRYLAGAVWDAVPSAHVTYLTIDQLRASNMHSEALQRADIVIVIAGMAVPGRYLSGFPVSPREVITILGPLIKPLTILCGPAARYGFGMMGGKQTKDTSMVGEVFDLIVTGDGECVLSEILANRHHIDSIDPSRCRADAHTIASYAIKGAEIVTQHPFFPHHLITEIETYRGCPRSIVGGCSFCSEPRKGAPDFRPIADIVDEVAALYQAGICHMRLGNQPCIFSYMAHDADSEEFPRPNPDALQQLFSSIRRVAPELRTLHVDNANPGIIARYPNEAQAIAKTIVRYHTPGDVAAFGVESVDPEVIKRNNLKASAEEVYAAIQLLNEVGAKRGNNGMPELLPGLNFVFGLKGETKDTFKQDYAFLKRIFDDNLLLRRINLRQLIPIPGTPLHADGVKLVTKHKHTFKQFKRQVQEIIERPLLQRLLPLRTVLTDIYMEQYDGKLTFGRQLGSYPLLIGIPGVYPLNQFMTAAVVDYGYRSITAIPHPLQINTAPRETLEALPGVGKKRAIRILANRPYATKQQFLASLDDAYVGQQIMPYLSFEK